MGVIFTAAGATDNNNSIGLGADDNNGGDDNIR
jgi:hypothetical protein